MPKYLLEVNDTLDGVKGVIAKGGSARKAAAQAAAKSLGGKLERFYFAFGGTDVSTVADMPDNAAAASLRRRPSRPAAERPSGRWSCGRPRTSTVRRRRR